MLFLPVIVKHPWFVTKTSILAKFSALTTLCEWFPAVEKVKLMVNHWNKIGWHKWIVDTLNALVVWGLFEKMASIKNKEGWGKLPTIILKCKRHPKMVANLKFSGCLSTTSHNSYPRIIMRKYAIVVAVLLTQQIYH